MNAPAPSSRLSRRALLKGGALTVGFVWAGMSDRSSRARRRRHACARQQGSRCLSCHQQPTAPSPSICGKVDLGQGLRIAIPQIAAEELGMALNKIKYVEGDTALTPDQGRTSGSNGIQRGGMQIRQAAATARKGLDRTRGQAAQLCRL